MQSGLCACCSKLRRSGQQAATPAHPASHHPTPPLLQATFDLYGRLKEELVGTQVEKDLDPAVQREYEQVQLGASRAAGQAWRLT